MKYGTPRSSVIGSDNALSQKSEGELQSSKGPEKNKRNVSGDYEDDDYYVGFTGFDKEVKLLIAVYLVRAACSVLSLIRSTDLKGNNTLTRFQIH